MKKKYWRIFKENYPIVLPSTFTMGLGTFLLVMYIKSFQAILQRINDPYIVGMFGIIFVIALVKLCSWIGYGIFEEWANKMTEAFTR